MPERSARSLWETALGQLELQVTRPNFETWLRHTVGLRLEGGSLTVGAPSDFVIEWLRSRLAAHINRTLAQIAGEPVTVHFEVLGTHPAGAEPSANGAAPAPAAQRLPSLTLDPRLTFSSFTPGQCNRLAFRAARNFLDDDCTYNPLILCGPPGLGKTHLLHAVGHVASERGLRVALLTGEEFVNRYVETVRAGSPQTLRHAFRSCQVFLLDDFQFLATRPGSQELFSHIFNTLIGQGTRIALTTDTPPRSLPGLGQSLSSRLEAGLIAVLHPPATEDRREILRAKNARLRKPLPETIIDFIADQPCQQIRELEGALNRVTAFSDLHTGAPLTLASVRHALYPLQPEGTPTPTPQQVINAVSAHFGIPEHQLRSDARSRDITYARHMAMFLLRTRCNRPLNDIAQLLGRRDHTTVLNGCRRIQRELRSLDSTRQDLEQIEAALLSSTSSVA